jgi:amino-acid N-acetyltransferase
MLIASAQQQDFKAVKELLAESDLYNADIDKESGHQFLIAWKEGLFIGSVALEVVDDVALLRSLAVKPEYRRRGVATKLVEAIESHAKSQQIKDLYLLTLTAADLFSALGYQKTDRSQAPVALQGTTEFMRVCPASAVCMTKKLY